jgi:hypothetical protein
MSNRFYKNKSAAEWKRLLDIREKEWKALDDRFNELTFAREAVGVNFAEGVDALLDDTAPVPSEDLAAIDAELAKISPTLHMLGQAVEILRRNHGQAAFHEQEELGRRSLPAYRELASKFFTALSALAAAQEDLRQHRAKYLDPDSKFVNLMIPGLDPGDQYSLLGCRAREAVWAGLISEDHPALKTFSWRQ